MKDVSIYEDEMFPVYYMHDQEDVGGDKKVAVSDELWERYKLAELEWDAVQDELAEIYKGN